MKYNELLFLEQSYKDSIENYNNILENKEKWPWDLVVITSSNERQKAVYEEQINSRIKEHLLPNIDIMVISDLDNKRIGSGGATLNVLREIQKKYHTFKDKKILLIHSGGDSKRVPQYSSCGKLFSKVPRELPNNNISTLFDEFMITSTKIAPRIKEGLLVLSGDVLLLFNPLQVDIDNATSAAISIKAKVETGTHHGVFLSDEKNILKRFLHKETKENLIKLNAVYQNNLIDIDTGCIYLSTEIVEKLYSLVENDIDSKKYINDVNCLSFYGDLLYPFASESTLEEYLTLPSEGTLDDNQKEIRKALWNTLNNYRLKVIKTFPSEFLHAGTTKEVKDLFVNATEKYNFLNWKSNLITNKNIKNTSIINSIIEDSTTIGEYSMIEDSIIKEGSIIGNNSVIINVKDKCNIKDNTVIQILPVTIDDKTKYVGRTYSISDNPKEKNIYFNKPYPLCFDSNTTLWDLPLFPVVETPKEAVEMCELIYRIIDKSNQEDIENLLSKKRLSLKESFNLSNITISIDENKKLKDLIISKIIMDKFNNKTPIADLLPLVNKESIKEVFKNIQSTKDTSYKKDALLSYLSKIYFKDKEGIYEDSCYNKINNSIKDNNITIYNGNYNITKDNIEVSSPVRINFAGGWSDTPPYCLENGGIVLNAAIKLNKELPIKVTVTSTNNKEITFISKDINEEKTITSFEEIEKWNTLNNPFILFYASLYILGINGISKLDKGLIITTNVNIPKGSGLGTSSILAGTLLKALSIYLGIKLTDEDLFTYVLYLEQLIKTGGGWQDQIGGLTNGIKLIETENGNKQVFNLTYLKENDNIKSLDNRLVLIYTGQRRIAKNVLRKIMNKYIYNDPNTIYILKEIQRLALLMKFELEKGTLDNFIKLINDHSKLIQSLDDEVTNTCINHIIKETTSYCDATHMVGAGGGGFIFAILKENVTSKTLQNHLNECFSDSGVKVYEADFYYGESL